MNSPIRSILGKTKAFAENAPIYLYVPLAYAVLVLLLFFLHEIGSLLGLSENDQSPFRIPKQIWLQYLLVAVLGPLLETFFFQVMPYFFLNLFEFMKKHTWITIVLPATLFGLLHAYSEQYLLYGMSMGLVFQLTFHIRFKKGDSFLSTYTLHALTNAVSITLNLMN